MVHRHGGGLLYMAAILSMLGLMAGCEPGDSVLNARTATAPMSAPPGGVQVGPVPGLERRPAMARNPFGRAETALQDGRRLFVWFNCAGCHGGHAGGGMGPSLRDRTWIYGNSDAHIFDSIASGRANGMPAWGTKLPQEQIWKLVAYIQSLRTRYEPQPPS